MSGKVFILLLFMAIRGGSQEVALLDRSFKKPVAYTDSVTVSMMQKGAFPLYIKDADKLITLIDLFLKNLNGDHPEKIATRNLQWGNTQLFTHARYQGRFFRCQLVVTTITPEASTSLVLVDESDPIPLALEKLNQISDYIKNNLALLKEDKLISNNEKKTTDLKGKNAPLL